MKKRMITLLTAAGLCIAGYSADTAFAADTVKGDANADGRFTIADVVLVRNWLYGVPDTHLSDWKAADLCEDGVLDVYDFCLMRSEVVQKYGLKAVENEEASQSSAPGTPGAVHTSLSVSYDEAKERFGYPIVKCSRSDFLGYKVGIVSRNGDIGSKEAFCLDLTYEFTNGHIYIQAQERSVGKLANHGTEQYDYLGRTFVMEDSYNDEQHTIGYYPTDTGGLAYRATFDRSVDIYEIMELIISVEL